MASAFMEGRLDYYKKNMKDMLVRNYGWSEGDWGKVHVELEKNIILLNVVKRSD